MNIRPIHNESAYKAALKEISILVDLDPEVDTQEGDRLEIMATLVQAYEAQQFPIELPDPIEAIKFRMEQSGMSPKDLVPMIGRSNRVYEVLNRTRPLTLIMIRKLHEQMGIPVESLIKPIVKKSNNAESGHVVSP